MDVKILEAREPPAVVWQDTAINDSRACAQHVLPSRKRAWPVFVLVMIRTEAFSW